MGRKFSIPEKVVFEVLDGEAVLLELQTGVYFSLNKTGTAAWKLLQESGDFEQVRTAMQSRYGVEPETLNKDLDDLVGRLIEKGLLVEDG